MTKTTRAPRVAEIAADEGYNLAGQPVLLAKLTAYVGRATFAQLAAIATAAGGEYSKHNAAFMFTDPAARESFAAQARVILTNPAPAAPPPAATVWMDEQRTAYARKYPQGAPDDGTAARIAANLAEYRAAHPEPGEAPAQAYTDAPTVETPPAIRVSVSRPIRSTITDRTPAGYGPSQPSLF